MGMHERESQPRGRCLRNAANQRMEIVGGPRFWRDRSCEIRRLDSVWATPEGWLTREAKIALAVGTANTSPRVAMTVPGQYGHFSARELNEVPRWASWFRSPMLIMQWCFPFLRQHSGKPASPSAPWARSGESRGRPKTASNRMERIFLNAPAVKHFSMCFSKKSPKFLQPPAETGRNRLPKPYRLSRLRRLIPHKRLTRRKPASSALLQDCLAAHPPRRIPPPAPAPPLRSSPRRSPAASPRRPARRA